MNSTRTYTTYSTEISRQNTIRKVEYEKIRILTEVHKNKIKKITQRIKLLRRELRRVGDREWKVRHIKKAAEEYLNIKLSYNNQSVKAQEGRNMVYKMAMQKGVQGVVVAEVFQCGKGIPYKQRDRYNKQLRTDANARLIWSSFSYFLRDYAIDNELIL